MTPAIKRVSALAREKSKVRNMAAAYGPKPRVAGTGSARRKKALEVLQKLIATGSRTGGQFTQRREIV